MISFSKALEKLSFKLNTTGKAEVKAERHFETSDPNWSEFEKNLRGKTFQKVVLKHPQADDKLKRYVEGYGGYLTSKDVVGAIRGDSGKTYKLKRVGGRIACGCKDWQYKKSHGGGDCKHVKAFKEKTKTSAGELGALVAVYRHPEILGDDAVSLKKKTEKKVKKEVLAPLGLAKEAFLNDLLTTGAAFSYNKALAKKKQQEGEASSLNAKMLKQMERERRLAALG